MSKKPCTNRPTTLPDLRRALRVAIANYMNSEGCNCCQDYESHRIDRARIAKLLNVPRYSDKSGYNFRRFKT